MRRPKALILAALFCTLTALGAFLRIPAPVASFTLQIFFTTMSGLLLGRRWGAASQAVYVLLGLAGLPIFTFGGGLSALTQPTFGFLLGLIPMAWVMGWITERFGFRLRVLCATCLAGLAVLYLTGLPYLHLILQLYLQQNPTFWQTVCGGMLLFLPWDLLKLTAACFLCRRIRPRLFL